MADGYATAFMVMNIEQSIEFANNHPDLYVLLIYRNESNKVQQFRNKQFINLE